jgi:hypothetical protein
LVGIAARLQPRQELLSTHGAHDPVQEDETRPRDVVAFQLSQRIRAVSRREYPTSGVFDQIGHGRANVVIVIDDQNGLGATGVLSSEHSRRV